MTHGTIVLRALVVAAACASLAPPAPADTSEPSLVWVRQSPTLVHDTVVDGVGNAFVAGSFTGTVDFDPGPGLLDLDADDGRSFVLKLQAPLDVVDDDADGFGSVDETTGNSGFQDPDDVDTYSWPAQAGALLYEVARATLPDFSADCVTFVTPDTFLVDFERPPIGRAFYYLNRATAPNVGSWGRAGGAQRTVPCAP